MRIRWGGNYVSQSTNFLCKPRTYVSFTIDLETDKEQQKNVHKSVKVNVVPRDRVGSWNIPNPLKCLTGTHFITDTRTIFLGHLSALLQSLRICMFIYFLMS